MEIDHRSVRDKKLDISGHCQLLIVGAGPAGIAAAIEAAKCGLSVTLVDENPVSFETMGESVPLFFGERMGGAVRNRNAMMEQLLESSPDLAAAFELGVDVRLGTACWGLFLNSENMRWMEKPVAGLADADQGSSLFSFDRAIVATGRRDMGLAFPGWDQPGVIGAAAATALLRRYGSLNGRRAVVLGSTAEALLCALDLCEAGIDVACVVEQAEKPIGPDDLQARLTGKGIGIHCSDTIRTVFSDADGVAGVELKSGRIDCDLIVLAVGVVPVIDLLAASGCHVLFDEKRGGFVPILDENLATSFPRVQAVGDCAGIWADKSKDDSIAKAEGCFAAQVAALHMGAIEAVSRPTPAQPCNGFDIGEYRKAWVKKSVIDAIEASPVCQCENVTARDILEVRPPHYIDWQAADNRTRSLDSELSCAIPDPDQIKRLTRAGMGPCQGRRCREQIQALLALGSGSPLHDVPLATYRAPVRPMPLKAAAPGHEDPAIVEQWDSWFGMPRQWAPYWDVEETYTVASLSTEKPHVSE